MGQNKKEIAPRVLSSTRENCCYIQKRCSFRYKIRRNRRNHRAIPPRLLKHESITPPDLSASDEESNNLASQPNKVLDKESHSDSENDSDDSESESDADESHSDSLSAAFALGVMKANTRRQQASTALKAQVVATSEKPSASRQLKDIIRAAQKQALQ